MGAPRAGTRGGRSPCRRPAPAVRRRRFPSPSRPAGAAGNPARTRCVYVGRRAKTTDGTESGKLTGSPIASRPPRALSFKDAATATLPPLRRPPASPLVPRPSRAPSPIPQSRLAAARVRSRRCRSPPPEFARAAPPPIARFRCCVPSSDRVGQPHRAALQPPVFAAACCAILHVEFSRVFSRLFPFFLPPAGAAAIRAR